MKMDRFIQIQRIGKPLVIVSGTAFLLLVFLAYGGYEYRALSRAFDQAKEDYASTTVAFEKKVAGLENELARSRDEGTKLNAALEEQKGKNDQLGTQIQSVTDTVSMLEKRITLDPELLQKYSKVFFLSENYTPATLTDITNSEYVYQTGKTVQIHTIVWLYLGRLLKTAEQEGVPLRILSGFRSFKDQSILKTGYKVAYGSGANQFSADQGYSEHQLGTTVDFTTQANGSALEKFKASPAYSWLLANAYKYGFTLSYPEGNSYYQFEPWHWRFVGTKLAARLFDDKQHFYDLDQRVIDQYLITIFD